MENNFSSLGSYGNEKWHLAKGIIASNSRNDVAIIGDVHLILADGCLLTSSIAFVISSDSCLTIYG